MADFVLKRHIQWLLGEYLRNVEQLFREIQGATEGGVKLDVPIQTIKTIIVVDGKLKKAIAQLEKHQQFQEKIIDLQNEVAVENQKIVGLVEELKKVEENLTETLDQAKIRLDVVKRAREINLSAHDILHYSHRINSTVSGPYGWQPNQPLETSLPPRPQDDMIRKSHLYQMYLNNTKSKIASGTNENEPQSQMDVSQQMEFDEDTVEEQNLQNPLLGLDFNF